MPQFDFYSFSTQVFYVLLGFVIFHFLILNFLVISYAKILKLRQKLYNVYLNGSVSKKNLNKTVYDSIISIIFKNFK